LIQQQESRPVGESRTAINLGYSLSVSANSGGFPVNPHSHKHEIPTAEWEAVYMGLRDNVRALCGFITSPDRVPVSSFGREFDPCRICADKAAKKAQRAA
jgi:hypothetical protein